MSVDNALAGVAARNAAATAGWYEQLIGEPGKEAMPGLFEWSLPGGGALQVFEDSERAGSSSVTLSVTGIDSHVAQLAGHGIAIGKRTHSKDVSTAVIEDPDGNQVVLAEQHSDKVAR